MTEFMSGSVENAICECGRQGLYIWRNEGYMVLLECRSCFKIWDIVSRIGKPKDALQIMHEKSRRRNTV